MKPEEILVQLVIGRAYANGNFRNKPEVLRLEPRAADHGEDGMNYSATYIPTHNGHYRYGIRVMPVHKGQASPLETGWCSGAERDTSKKQGGAPHGVPPFPLQYTDLPVLGNAHPLREPPGFHKFPQSGAAQPGMIDRIQMASDDRSLRGGHGRFVQASASMRMGVPS